MAEILERLAQGFLCQDFGCALKRRLGPLIGDQLA